ncbi:phage tail protein I [Cupriavidus sp. SW-Y-13]|uniref:phage tail protein I n=1 Tax=Cupriavidus sp. SW-Y-13 TaxID=2653854 RepID=UPI0013652EF2|nr:phage tail protein I [Cupriavidus sp. SW-Y-13]MWL87153.1 phage tail protein I [Cupriavidus sp. SW-Y-13]
MADLLPPNASPVERRLAETGARLSEIPSPLRDLMRPDNIPLELLPWLAWHLGIDAWKSYWPESMRRALVASAIPVARMNGTAAAVREVIGAFGRGIVLREWWETTPRGRPGTFEVILSAGDGHGVPATADLVGDIMAEIDRTKPVRAHYTFTQAVRAACPIAVAMAARPAVYRRLTLSAA